MTRSSRMTTRWPGIRTISAAWPFGPDLAPGSADLIAADPAWRFVTFNGDPGSKGRPYRTMKFEDILALPVRDLAAPQAALLLWATWPMLPQAFQVIDAWGFTFKTGGSWHKRTRNGKTAFGTGYLQRSASEPYLLATRGRPRVFSRSERGAWCSDIDAPLREDSRKPDAIFDMLGRLFGDGRRVELFSREDRPGWTAWGDQAGYFNGGADG